MRFEITVLEFEQNPVRWFEENNELWFCAKDVCNI